MNNKKEIISLSDFEHAILKPNLYVGSTDLSEEKVPIIENEKIILKNKLISVGFYKIFDEVLDNAIDEGKRINGKMKKLSVNINTKTNEVIIEDTGEGFHKGIKINSKTGLNNIDTAFSCLRAGSNFKNEDTKETLVGTHGMGVTLTNMFSSFFKVEVKTNEYHYKRVWKKFKPTKPIQQIGRQSKTGTKIAFIPRSDIFKDSKWDKEVIKCLMTLKNYQIKLDPVISKLKLEVKIDGEKLNLKTSIFPTTSNKITTDIGQLVIWESFEGSTSLSFVNTAMCTGVHQKIINDKINDKLGDTLGHHFYETLFIVNLPPKLVRFGDQNKTKFVSTRFEIESTIEDYFHKKLNSFFRSHLFQNIKKKVDERKRKGEISNLKNAKRRQRIQYSHKYHSASAHKENLFIVEGLSAGGSLLQKRDPKNDGVYSLKGKIKNAKSISDLIVNKEIIELMKILDLDVDKKSPCPYDRIVISTDADPDGYHICSLIINLFHRWFPHIIKEGKLYIMSTPLISVGNGKGREYYYNNEEFQKRYKNKIPSGIRYLKGLGSLAIEDWEYVMKHKIFHQVKADKEAAKHMDIAFGNSSQKRKIWLKIKE